VTFSALNLDRNNFSQANSDNILPDLGMNANDYNWRTVVFGTAFLFAELPSQLVSKYLEQDCWIPIEMCIWSILTVAQFWLSGRGSFLALRTMFGLIQRFYSRSHPVYEL
ncbi:hypothetical protein M422DRAFT_162033, partial [Sphaerobolus stellatus SS14]